MFKKYALLGATDRINYGDNLFPILIQKYIRDEVGSDAQIKNYGVLASDLKSYGALPTHPVSKLYEDEFSKDARVIVVGGEVLGGDWAGIYKYCNPFFHTIYDNKIGKRLIPHNWVRSYLGGKGVFPFVPTPGMFKYDVSIAFNAVGGARDPRSAAAVVPLLQQSDYKSFRDQGVFTSLKKAGLNEAVLTPDSAILMSKVFSASYIDDHVNESSREYVNGEPYIYFQVGNFKGGQEVENLAKQLTRILTETDLRLCLCPIGLAAGHDDHIALGNIYEVLLKTVHKDRVAFFPAPNLWDTMLLIKQSACYLGTSLHGIITAQSFSIPYLLINEKIKKGVDYMQSWGVSDLVCTAASLEKFDEAFLAMPLRDISGLVRKATEIQLELAVKNMNAVLGIL